MSAPVLQVRREEPFGAHWLAFYSHFQVPLPAGQNGFFFQPFGAQFHQVPFCTGNCALKNVRLLVDLNVDMT